MLKYLLLPYLVFVTLLLITCQTASAYTIQGTATNITGVDGLSVLGFNYDVTFQIGSVDEVYTNGQADLIFDEEGAIAATNALINGPYFTYAQYNLNPDYTYGVGSSATMAFIFTPYTIASSTFSAAIYKNTASINTMLNTTVSKATYSATMDNGYVYAKWSRTAAVPEPSTVVLLGIGLLGMAGINRKRSN